MAHFAKISEENEVLSVLILDDKDMLNADGVEKETVGQAYLEQHNNWPAHLWIQTSYNTHSNVHQLGGTPLRGNYAAIGYIWDSTNQIFLSQKPYSSWVKNLTNAKWESPVGNAPELTTEQKSQNEIDFTHKWIYSWNEENQTWDLLNTLS
tara:strand:+ start:226 stop:678 length:453 start_codon:yes stop_codon:yes gene_type:complete